jgi:hypothetical protein
MPLNMGNRIAGAILVVMLVTSFPQATARPLNQISELGSETHGFQSLTKGPIPQHPSCTNNPSNGGAGEHCPPTPTAR